MYNVNFEGQLRRFRQDLYGNRAAFMTCREASATTPPYFPPAGMRMIPCVQASNGEWVPDPKALEEKAKPQ